MEIRISREEHELESAAATQLGVTLSEFYRRAARSSAEQVLAERSRIVLGEQDAARFVAALDHPECFEGAFGWLAERPSLLKT